MSDLMHQLWTCTVCVDSSPPALPAVQVVMEVATERSQRFHGRTLEVLVEGVNPKDNKQAFGRIRHNKLVYFNGNGIELKGRLVMVRIDQCNAFSLFGQMVEVLPIGSGALGVGRNREEQMAV